MPMPIYLNEKLLSEVYPIVIDGFIESKSIKFMHDKSDFLRLQTGRKNQKSEDNKVSNNNKERNKVEDVSKSVVNDFSGYLDDRAVNRNELTIKKIYTKFYLFYDLRNTLVNKNMLKFVTDEDIINNNLISGEYIEFNSNIISESTCNQVTNLLDIIKCYGSNDLNKLLQNTDMEKSITNYTIIEKQLEILKKFLEISDSANVVTKLNKCKAVLNVDRKCFYSNNIYDNSNFPCKILGKVLRCEHNKGSICLLDKTGMDNYYIEFLNSLEPYLNILRNNNIITPKSIITEIEAPVMQIIPIGMYV
ncbi:hypothetical protein BS638_04720 [Clostridium tepidum]|jgi:hypothetical protein|uniref:Uncharacterized protein n=2 Tax=Clostridium tepidum TaxID=1962263 RepID=A0A1S9IED0_9CLOT|nr:hypothetical protein BS637_02655 [Clostridium tepidum]OOO68605.1 hypothetical protein BS638_04720 [Clostridium tepidum]